MNRWLTRKQASERVGRSERTIRRWEERGLNFIRGRVSERELVEKDQEMRSRVGRPKKGGNGE